MKEETKKEIRAWVRYLGTAAVTAFIFGVSIRKQAYIWIIISGIFLIYLSLVPFIGSKMDAIGYKIIDWFRNI